MRRSDLFNSNSICIFTDSSFRNYNLHERIAIGCTAPFAIVIRDDKIIDYNFDILHNTTTQQGELYAILLGVMLAYKYKDYYPNIRLFSDSQSSIFAIRDRIFKWVKKDNFGLKTEKYLGPDGTIKNQDYIMDIVYYILDAKIPIEFYHVKGHVTGGTKSLYNAMTVFVESNFPHPIFPELDLVKTLADFNNAVDHYSTEALNLNFYNPAYDRSGLIPAITPIGYVPIDMKEYKKYVKLF